MIACICFIMAGVFCIVALVLLLHKQKGSWRSAGLALCISILSAVFGCYIQWGFNWAVKRIDIPFIISDSSESSEELTEEHIHEGSLTEKESVIDATCTESGSYELVVYCDCGEELSRETVIVDALGHNYKIAVTLPTCTESGFTTYNCTRCGDSYKDEVVEALGHDFAEGICIRCGYEDPDYVKVYSDAEIMEVLAESVASDSGHFKSYTGEESISVFATERYNCFSINTAVSYNMWGGNVQNVIFNVLALNEIGLLSFDIGGETGSSGSMMVEIFIDKSIDDTADYTYEFNASDIPMSVTVDIEGATSLGFRVTNQSGNENRIVFFNFREGDTK